MGRKVAPYRELMYRDLMRVYNQVYQEGDFSTAKDCFEEVVKHPAPRFYLDTRWAHTILSPMLRGNNSKLEDMKPLRRQMFQDLFDTVVRLSQSRQYYGRTLNYILQFAVQEPAPRFYISAERMEQIWLEQKRKNSKGNGWIKLKRQRRHERDNQEISEVAHYAGGGAVVGVHAHCGV